MTLMSTPRPRHYWGSAVVARSRAQTCRIRLPSCEVRRRYAHPDGMLTIASTRAGRLRLRQAFLHDRQGGIPVIPRHIIGWKTTLAALFATASLAGGFSYADDDHDRNRH